MTDKLRAFSIEFKNPETYERVRIHANSVNYGKHFTSFINFEEPGERYIAYSYATDTIFRITEVNDGKALD